MLVGGLVTIGITPPLWLVLAVSLAAFFVVALALHGELAADRPPAAQLTQFYAFVSLGGALGGSFNVLVAPNIFNSLTEYPIALVLAAFLLPMWKGSWRDELSVRRHLLPPLAIAGAGCAAIALTEGDLWPHRSPVLPRPRHCLPLARNSLRLAWSWRSAMVAVWVPTTIEARSDLPGPQLHRRDRVESQFGGIIHEFKHGEIVHGAQIGSVGITPITYYHPTGPMGQLFEALPTSRCGARRGGQPRGGVDGLLQPSGRPVRSSRSTPAVVKIARNNELFSYLRRLQGTRSTWATAGLSLKRRRNSEFGVIALDAFSADAIPMHTITREAVELYLEKLDRTG